VQEDVSSSYLVGHIQTLMGDAHLRCWDLPPNGFD